MNKTMVRIVLVISLLALQSISCSFFTKAFQSDEPTQGPALSQEEEEETPTEAAPGVEEEVPSQENPTDAAGDQVFVYDEGGFEFTPLDDWQITCAMGIIQMKAPDASPEYGPAFLIMAGDNQDAMTTEEAFAKFRAESTAAKIDDPKKVKVGGFPALQSEMISLQGGEEIRAMVLTSMLTSYRQFTMMASAPGDRWEEIELTYPSVLESIRFIAPVPDAGCPGDMGNQDSGDAPVVEEQPSGSTGGLLHQWASSARASSEYGDDGWSASQATGEPDSPDCGDSMYAWASLEPDSQEWLELTYDTPVYPTSIVIHMNYNPSQVYEVQMIDVNGDAYTVIETEPEYIEYCPDVYEISLDLTEPILVNKVKVFIDQGVLGLGWTEIDAVELVGSQDEAVAIFQPGDDTLPANGADVSPYLPGDLEPGAFIYGISGFENDELSGANVQYQSTDHSYVVGLISKTERYIVSLILPKKGIKQGLTQMIPYEKSAGSNTPTAAIYINAFLYVVDSGQIDIQSDPKTGKLTGVFSFKAHSKDFPDRMIEVTGAVNNIPLK